MRLVLTVRLSFLSLSSQVTPITRTNVKVEWTPLSESDFNGDSSTGGYQIEYREIADYSAIGTQSAPRWVGDKKITSFCLVIVQK